MATMDVSVGSITAGVNTYDLKNNINHNMIMLSDGSILVAIINFNNHICTFYRKIGLSAWTTVCYASSADNSLTMCRVGDIVHFAYGSNNLLCYKSFNPFTVGNIDLQPSAVSLDASFLGVTGIDICVSANGHLHLSCTGTQLISSNYVNNIFYFKSTNGGSTWTETKLSSNVTQSSVYTFLVSCMALMANDYPVIFTGFKQGSSNSFLTTFVFNGSSWVADNFYGTTIFTFIDGKFLQNLHCAVDKNNKVYLIGDILGTWIHLFRWDGVTLENLSTGFDGLFYPAITIDPVTDRIYFYCSKEAGATPYKVRKYESATGNAGSFTFTEIYSSIEPYSLCNTIWSKYEMGLEGGFTQPPLLFRDRDGSFVTTTYFMGTWQVMAEVYGNVNGVWKQADSIFANIGGIWKDVDTIDVNIGGVWKDT